MVDPHVLGVPLREWQTIGMLLAVAFVVYLLLGFAVGLALRRWGSRFRFGDVPELASRIGGEAQAVAIAEVARFGVRRDYARMARAAADILEHGSQHGAEVARGVRRPARRASTRPRPTTTCPACHRTASWSRRSSSSRWPGPTPAASTASTRCT